MSNAEKLSTGRVIARSLVRKGVDSIFVIPGAHTYDFIDALHECRDRIRFIVNRHEQGSGYMAYGYAKSTGRVGAFTVVPGPGVLNAGAALCAAYWANAPALCITGNIPSYHIGRGRGIVGEDTPYGFSCGAGIKPWLAGLYIIEQSVDSVEYASPMSGIASIRLVKHASAVAA